MRQADGTYLKKSLPPLEFGYTEAVINEKLQEIDPESLENLPPAWMAHVTSGSTSTARAFPAS